MSCKYCEIFEMAKHGEEEDVWSPIERIEYEEICVDIGLKAWAPSPSDEIVSVGDEASMTLSIFLNDKDGKIEEKVKDLDDVFKDVEINFCPFCGRKILKMYNRQDVIAHTKNGIRYFRGIAPNRNTDLIERQLHLAEMVMQEEVKNGSDTEAH